jgi:hypothetical protein
MMEIEFDDNDGEGYVITIKVKQHLDKHYFISKEQSVKSFPRKCVCHNDLTIKFNKAIN